MVVEQHGVVRRGVEGSAAGSRRWSREPGEIETMPLSGGLAKSSATCSNSSVFTQHATKIEIQGQITWIYSATTAPTKTG